MLLTPETKAEIEFQLKEAYDHRGDDLNRSLLQTSELLARSETLRFDEGVAQAKNQLSLFHMIRGEFDKSELLAKEALAYFEKTGNTRGIADARYTLGGIYYRTNKYPQGLVELSNCLAAYRQLEDHANQARTLKSMGTIFEYFSDWEQGIDSYQKSIEASKKAGDTSLESNALNPLSSIYHKQGKKALAFETIERSILLKTEINDVRGLAFALYGRAKLLLKEGKPDESLIDLDKSISIHIRVGDKLGLGMAYNKLGVAYQMKGDLTKAKECYLSALEIATNYQVQIIRFKANLNLYKLAKIQGETSLALEYLEEYLQQRESIFSNENYNLIKSYQAILKLEALEREAQAQKELTEVIKSKNAELDSFFYRVSHDLKGPISSLIGLNQVVQKEIRETEAKAYFEMYHHQIQRMNNIVMSLIDITRMKHIEVKKEVIDFRKLIAECIRSYEHLPAFKEISFKVEVDTDRPFYSEWVILNTILQNLIENAIKYSRQNAHSFVKIGVRNEGEWLHLDVEDNGQGIPHAHQDRIFDMFHRANENVTGSGLGLYILKRAVERLNGSIRVSSEPNEGSRFIVTLPFAGDS